MNARQVNIDILQLRDTDEVCGNIAWGHVLTKNSRFCSLCFVNSLKKQP